MIYEDFAISVVAWRANACYWADMTPRLAGSFQCAALLLCSVIGCALCASEREDQCSQRVVGILKAPTKYPRPNHGHIVGEEKCLIYRRIASQYICRGFPSVPNETRKPTQPFWGLSSLTNCTLPALCLGGWQLPLSFVEDVLRVARSVALADRYVFLTFVQLDQSMKDADKWTSRPSVVLDYARRAIGSFSSVHNHRYPLVLANDAATLYALRKAKIAPEESLVLDTTEHWREPVHIMGLSNPVSRGINVRYIVLLLLLTHGFSPTFFDIDSQWLRPLELPYAAVSEGADVILAAQYGVDKKVQGRDLRAAPTTIPGALGSRTEAMIFRPLRPSRALANDLIRYCPPHADNIAVNCGFQVCCFFLCLQYTQRNRMQTECRS